MGSSLLLSCVLLSLSVCALGDNRVHTSGDVTWMLMADENGEPQLAILNGYEAEPKAVVLRENVTFILYTRENDATDGVRIYLNEPDSITEYDPAKLTKILIHGFWGGLTSQVIQDTRRAYMEKGYDYNIIGVDWGVLCPSPFYNLAKDNALLVGPYVAQLIDFLVEETGAKLLDMQLIGHSLGGQVIGIAGGRVSGGRIARVTGLDPALPLFDVETDENRLDPTDGVLVDVVHTDGGGLGWLTPVGHIDFYPNGGKAPQPGCGGDITGQCSHTRCHVWYADSVNNPDKYAAAKCDTFEDSQAATCATENTGMLGDQIGDTAPGVYYLRV